MMYLNRTPRFRTMRNATFGLLVAGSMLLAACGDDDPAPTQTPSSAAPTATVQVSTPTPEAVAPTSITIDMHDFGFTLPDSLAAGWVEIEATNSGQEPHHVIVAKLNAGVTLAAFNAAMQEDPDAAFGLVEMAGGVPDTAPGQTQRTMLKLSAGSYVALCFVSGEDGLPHVAKGMQADFTVTPSTAVQEQPSADVTVDMHDFAYTMPDELAAGDMSMLVKNTGQQPHEMIVFKLNEGATLDDFMAFATEMENAGPDGPSGPPPGEQVGGAYPIGAAGEMVINMHLEAGSYIGVCFIPDPATGQSHLALGMVKEFTVK